MMDWSIIGLVAQLALIACVLSAAGTFILRCIDTVEAHRATIRARHAADVQHYQIAPGHHVFVRGNLRDVDFVEFQSDAPMPSVDMRQTPINVNGEQVGVVREQGYYHAVEVLRQSRAANGDNSDRIIPAAQFSGSPDTWQSGVDWLRVKHGVAPQPGRGTWTGQQHPTLLSLFRAVTSPTPAGNGGAPNGM